jgi:hypothetical protein
MHPAWAWDNGGADQADPTYGTHDWMAERALDWIPPNEKALILTYRAAYLYGTEMPDKVFNDEACCHHVYFWPNGTVQDNASARRAMDMYDNALQAFTAGNLTDAAKWTGAMTHYVDDLASFGHVMGVDTSWGLEAHHTAYESYVERRTDSPNASEIPLSFDGSLASISPFQAAIGLARDTTFDLSGMGHTAVWMSQHYNWSDPVFTARAYQSINLAVNYVAEAVHAIWSTYVVTTTTSQQVTTSTTQVQTTTTSTTQQTTTSTTQTQQTIQVESSGMGFAFAFIGIGAGAAAAALGVAVAASGGLGSQILAYGGYYYCRRHRVPVWSYSGYLWCPIERRYLRP